MSKKIMENGTKRTRKFFGEFKEFAMRGNVWDLAVGVIIGGAFQKIVSSLVGDVVSPLLGLLGNSDFSAYSLKIGEVEVKYGAFLTTIIDFIIMALVIFLMIKAINKLSRLGKKEEEEKSPATKKCPFCCSEISIYATRCPHCTSELE